MTFFIFHLFMFLYCPFSCLHNKIRECANSETYSSFPTFIISHKIYYFHYTTLLRNDAYPHNLPVTVLMVRIPPVLTLSLFKDFVIKKNIFFAARLTIMHKTQMILRSSVKAKAPTHSKVSTNSLVFVGANILVVRNNGYLRV